MNTLLIPSDFNHILNKLETIPSNELSILINQTIQGLVQNNYKHINLQSLTNKFQLPLQDIEDVFGILLSIVKWCYQFRFHPEKEIKSALMEQGFSNEWSSKLVTLVFNKNDIVFTRYLPEIEQFYWRIDISLLNSSLQKKIPPTVFWSIRLKDGTKYIIEINLRKFHEIRFNVSTILKEMNVVKNNSLLKK